MAPYAPVVLMVGVLLGFVMAWPLGVFQYWRGHRAGYFLAVDEMTQRRAPSTVREG